MKVILTIILLGMVGTIAAAMIWTTMYIHGDEGREVRLNRNLNQFNWASPECVKFEAGIEVYHFRSKSAMDRMVIRLRLCELERQR